MFSWISGCHVYTISGVVLWNSPWMVGRCNFSIIHVMYWCSRKGRPPAWLPLPAASLLLCHPKDSSQSKCWQRAAVTPCVVTCSSTQHQQTAARVTGVFCRVRISLPREKKWRFRDSWRHTVIAKTFLKAVTTGIAARHRNHKSCLQCQRRKKVSGVLSRKPQDHKKLLYYKSMLQGVVI